MVKDVVTEHLTESLFKAKRSGEAQTSKIAHNTAQALPFRVTPRK